MLLQLFLLSQSHVPPCRGVKGRDLLSNVAAENPLRGPQPPYDTAHHPWVTVARCSSWHACHWCRQANYGYSQKKWHSYTHETFKGTALCMEGNCMEKSWEQGRRWSWSLVRVQVITLRVELFPPFLWDNTLTNFFLSWTSPFKEMVLYT